MVVHDYNHPMWNTDGVKSLWSPERAAECATLLELRAYSSRCLGRDPALVLYGGGNTSLKDTWLRADGESTQCLYVKGTGSDLAQVTGKDFTALELHRVQSLLAGPVLDNQSFKSALAPLKLDETSPPPSIETLLHAVLPYRFVEHTHADSVLALVNTRRGRNIVDEVYGELAPLVPFHHSGFELAKACHTVFRQQSTARTIGLILEFHGVIAFGHDARSSYENMIELVRRAEDYLRSKRAWTLPMRSFEALSARQAREFRALRREWSAVAGFPVVLALDHSEMALGYAQRNDISTLVECAPPTPQHAVFTKRHAMHQRDLIAFASAYQNYVTRHRGIFPSEELPDNAPRVCVDPAFGIVAASVDAQHAEMTLEMYRHDIEILSRAQSHDQYVSLEPEAILAAEVHYGGFDRKLRALSVSGELPLLGVIVLIVEDHVLHTRALERELSTLGASIVVLSDRESTSNDNASTRFVHIDDSVSVSTIAALSTIHGGADLIISPLERSALAHGLLPVLDSSPIGAAIILCLYPNQCESDAAFESECRVVCTATDTDSITATARWLLEGV